MKKGTEKKNEEQDPKSKIVLAGTPHSFYA